MNQQRLIKDLMDLSYVYPLAVDDDYKKVIVKGFRLPPGYNHDTIAVLLELPEDYPESPPGVGGSKVFVPNDLRYQGRKPKDLHEYSGPKPGWAWWCYERIDWDPCKDNLISFFEMVRAHLTRSKRSDI